MTEEDFPITRLYRQEILALAEIHKRLQKHSCSVSHVMIEPDGTITLWITRLTDAAMRRDVFKPGELMIDGSPPGDYAWRKIISTPLAGPPSAALH